MPVPPKERVIELLSDLVHRQGYDLEDVAVTLAGKHSVVRVMIDSDTGLDLDDVAELSRTISEIFDATPEFGAAPYTLEVTSPGIDRPLTEDRHWRRARGRKVKIDLADESVTGRIGVLGDGVIAIVLPGKGGPSVREIALADIDKAVVQVEFSPPNERELELAGGVAEGRVASAQIDETDFQVDEEVEG
ncbi:ribosome maturation factor RimP [Rhodococcus oryzae]|uniref:ribosome maturation factor RimP n=1 Tax=Rhodococcus oryzae TaxID=2571143 RepID=UPI0037BBE829